MRALIRFGVDRPVLMNLLFIGLLAYGVLVALPRLAVERYPDVDMGEVYVDTFWAGADPEDVERLVTRPIEDAVRGMDGIEYVRAASTTGRSQIRVKIADGEDSARRFDQLRLRVQAAQGLLPQRDGKLLVPNVWKLEVDAWMPALQASVVQADDAHPVGARQLALLADELRLSLERVPGVKRVVVDGARGEQFTVELDPERLERHRVTLADVAAALAAAGRSLPAGSVEAGGGERFVRVDARYRVADDVLGVVVRRDGDGAAVRVADLVDPAATGVEETDRGAGGFDGGLRVSVDGRAAVTCKVLKLANANVLAMRTALRAAIDAFAARRAGEGIAVVTSLDSAARITDDIGALASNLAQGAALVVVALLAFLSWRSAALAVSGQLFAILATLIAFQLLGYSLNQMTLLALMLIEGVLVDDAIVVCDNIHRHRERGKDLRTAVVDGVVEVFWPLVNGTATIVLGFLPLLLMTGAAGEFFRMIPVTVAIAMGLSLFECLLLLPLHAIDLEHWTGVDRRMLRAASADDDARGRRGALGVIARGYDRCLRWTLGHPKATLGGIGALVLMAAALLLQARYAADLGMRPIMRLALFPDDAQLLNVRVRMPPGTSLATTDGLLRRISRDLVARGKGEIGAAIGQAGMILDQDYHPQFAHEYGTIVAELPSLAERDAADATAQLRAIRADLVGRYARDGIALAVGTQEAGFPTGRPLTARVAGPDEAQVGRLAADLLAWLRVETTSGALRGVVDLDDDQRLSLDRVSYAIDRDRLALAGIDETRATDFIAAAVDGAYVADVRRGDGDIPLRVRLARAVAADPARLARVPIVDEPGRVVRFADVGALRLERVPATLTRRDFQRTVTIGGDLADDAIVGRADIEDAIARWYAGRAAAYPGATILFGGDADSADRSFRTLAVSFAVAFFLVYGCLAAQFRSYVQPLVIMSNGVFAAIGVVLCVGAFGVAHQVLPEGWVRPERALFTLPCMIAIVGLTGMVVNEDIVLVDFINARRAEGVPLREALLRAGQQRLRAVLLTSVTTIAGLITTAIGMPFSIAWSPMATCFVAGLVVSGAMTMLALPVIYELVDRCVHRASVPPATDRTADRGPRQPVAASPTPRAADDEDLVVILLDDADETDAPVAVGGRC